MNKKVVVLGILAVCLSISIGIGFSYAVWNQTEVQSGTNLFQSGCFSISYTDDNNIINFNNAYPIPDEKGMQQEAYTFTIKNTCNIYAHFSVNLEKLNTSTMDDQYIKLQLNNRRPMLYSAYNSVSTALDNTSSSRSLDFGGLEPETEKTYSLRLWIDNDATNGQVGGSTFQALISVVSTAAEPTGAEYIENLLATNTKTMANDDPDENVRYIGQDPNNYVTFNDELWRIIGVFYVKPSENGDYEKRIKIIRKDRLTSQLPWASSNVNNWSNASLQKLLNEGDYWQHTGDYEEIGLTDVAKNMIETTMWNLGGPSSSVVLAEQFYTVERSEIVYENNPKKWIGKVGLMYPSDYGYATGGEVYGRDSCLAKDLYGWSEGNFSNCKNNDWLYNANYAQWTLTPRSGYRDISFLVNSSGYGHSNNVNAIIGVRPVVYLKSDVKIIHDDNHIGSEKKPYELSI